MLELALDRLACTKTAFVGQFEMLGAFHRRAGGQGTVQFAQATHSGAAVAIKFFLNRNAFDVEEGLYMREGLRGMMPAITLIENNDSVHTPIMHACMHVCNTDPESCRVLL